MEYILVLAAHFLGDFIFQPDELAEKKKDNIWFLLLHSVIYIISFIFVFLMFGVYWEILIYIFVVLILHFLTDLFKNMLAKKFNSDISTLILFILDLVLHVAVVISIAYWGFKPNGIYAGFNEFLIKIFGEEKLFYVFLVLSLIICLKPASVFIKYVLAAVERKTPKENTEDSLPEALTKDSGIDRAGSLIGKLERVIMLILGAMGLYSLIGLVLTAKSLARFKQFEKQNFAERYLIGTLFSLLVAAVLLFVLHKISTASGG